MLRITVGQKCRRGRGKALFSNMLLFGGLIVSIRLRPGSGGLAEL